MIHYRRGHPYLRSMYKALKDKRGRLRAQVQTSIGDAFNRPDPEAPILVRADHSHTRHCHKRFAGPRGRRGCARERASMHLACRTHHHVQADSLTLEAASALLQDNVNTCTRELEQVCIALVYPLKKVTAACRWRPSTNKSLPSCASAYTPHTYNNDPC